MKNFAVSAAALVLVAACASAPVVDEDNLVPPAQTAAATSDPRSAELQTTLTELLERLDVMNDRIARLEERTVAAPAAAVAPATQAPAPVVASPSSSAQPTLAGAAPTASRALLGAQIADDYRQAIMLYGRGRTADARRAFQNVFDADPTGELADNALFWIGETYFAANDFSNAMRYYSRVTTEFGDQNKAPDALYKTAMALAKTGDIALARRTLQDVITKYPYSTPAGSAKQELARLKY
ncbi:MAG TPA: tol-pal system protein YbgF [Thermoanaerobaculia bacterium]